jgi:hypothetical protein
MCHVEPRVTYTSRRHKWKITYYIDGSTYVIYHLQKHPKSTQRGR